MRTDGNISTYLLILVISAVMISCEQPEGPVGSGIGSGSAGQTCVDTFQVEQDTSLALPAVNTGGSQYVYIGSAFNIESHGLIRFNRPLMPAEWTLNSAWIELSYEAGIGSDERIWIGTKLIDFEWSEADPPEWGTVLSGSSGDEWNTSTFLNRNDEFYKFQLPNVWVQKWLEWNYSSEIDTVWTDTTRNDSALTLYMTGPENINLTNLMLKFRARISTEDSLRPKLFLDITGKVAPDSAEYQDTLSVTPAGDLFLVKNHAPETGQNLFIGSGASYKTHVKFNLNQLFDKVNSGSHHIIVNRSVVMLYKNLPISSDLPRTESIWPFKLSDEAGFSNIGSDSEVGISIVTTAIDSASETVEIVVTRPVADWMDDSSKNFGLSFHSATEGYRIDRLGFYSSEAAESLRPKLIVYYTEIAR